MSAEHEVGSRIAGVLDRQSPLLTCLRATSDVSMSAFDYDRSYAGIPPWDIDGPQPAFVRLADDGLIAGRVLDAGCGTGENALFLAERGLDVLGIDVSPSAIAEAVAKTERRRLRVLFRVGDALDLRGLGATFDTVIDCGLLHGFSDSDQATYATQLHAVVRPGGLYHVLCFNEHAAPPGPRHIRRLDIEAVFAQGWRLEAIVADHFETVDGSGLNAEAAAGWLATLRRL
jgi:SAM-dependent methyltransferase